MLEAFSKHSFRSVVFLFSLASVQICLCLTTLIFLFKARGTEEAWPLISGGGAAAFGALEGVLLFTRRGRGTDSLSLSVCVIMSAGIVGLVCAMREVSESVEKRPTSMGKAFCALIFGWVTLFVRIGLTSVDGGMKRTPDFSLHLRRTDSETRLT